MAYKQHPLVYLTFICLFIWVKSLFAFNSTQKELIENFFNHYAETILKIAHPTVTYGSSTVSVLEDKVYIDIDYYSWTHKNLSIQLAFSIRSDGILQSLQVNHDSPGFPPFKATEELKNAAINMMSSNEDQDTKGMMGTLYKSLQNNLNNVTGEQLCVFILNSNWIGKGFFKIMQLYSEHNPTSAPYVEKQQPEESKPITEAEAQKQLEIEAESEAQRQSEESVKRDGIKSQVTQRYTGFLGSIPINMNITWNNYKGLGSISGTIAYSGRLLQFSGDNDRTGHIWFINSDNDYYDLSKTTTRSTIRWSGTMNENTTIIFTRPR